MWGSLSRAEVELGRRGSRVMRRRHLQRRRLATNSPAEDKAGRGLGRRNGGASTSFGVEEIIAKERG
jgi:hypothetical protein